MTEHERTSPREPSGDSPKKRIVILGGGFAGVYTARHLERELADCHDAELTLVSRENYFLMTPLLFEAGSGVLEPRHAVNPIRPLLERTRFIEAKVVGIDFERRAVKTKSVPAGSEAYDIPFDHVVLALGGVVNTRVVPGAAQTMTFKTLGDAISLRNHVIQTLERADVERDPGIRSKQLTIVVIGGGLVGVELVGELTEFLPNARRAYHNLKEQVVRFILIEGEPHLVPEFERPLAEYATEVLKQRGVDVRTSTRIARIEAPTQGRIGKVTLPDGEVIEAGTVVAAMGVIPSPVVSALTLEKDKKGRVVVQPTLRSKSHPFVWALGDCASIPDPDGKPYPPLAQHALREARIAARNIAAVVMNGERAELKSFIYKNKGTLAALGHFKGVGRVYKFRIYGFVAWWVWRTYYLMQMPQWSRRIRIVLDWTIALLFRNDIVQLDFNRPSEHDDASDGSAEPGRGAHVSASADEKAESGPQPPVRHEVVT